MQLVDVQELSPAETSDANRNFTMFNLKRAIYGEMVSSSDVNDTIMMCGHCVDMSNDIVHSFIIQVTQVSIR